MSELTAIEKARVAAKAGLDRKARDPVVLDVREVVSFADAFVFLTGGSNRQVRAIAEAIQQALKQRDERPLGVEGLDDGRWVLMDWNDVIVHIFQPEVREHYDLERLWSDAPRVELDLPPPDDLQRSAN
ncbi:MAG: ribosome silencing factor [Deltaproteobacteria bacterium]|nr:ribosome silencing factor [Deltaproteobacteria bacterium]MBW2362988.1 ribosome silencing factor [Deltaproteobacteria bacterium]